MAKTAQKVVSDLFRQVDAIRIAKGMSWHALAHSIGSSPATMTRFIAGDTVSLQTYLLLSEFVMENESDPDEEDDECPEGKHRMPDGSCMDDEEMAGSITTFDAAVQTFSVHGDMNLPIADRDYDWDGGAAADRVFEHFTKGGDKVDADGVAKAFLWRNDDMPAEEKGAWGLGFADIVSGKLMLIPRGLAAAAGGHGIGQIEGLGTEDIDNVKRKICQGYARVQEKFEDWPDCPHSGDRKVESGPANPPKDRRDRSDRERALAAAVAIVENPGEPVEGIIAVEGTPSGDGRMLEKGSIEWDDAVLPVPIIWDRLEGDHSGMTVGAIAEVWRDGTDIWGRGWLSASEDPETQAAVVRVKELFEEGAVGVSVALDHVDVELRVKKSAILGKGGPELPEDPNDLEEDENGYATLGRMMADDALEVTTRGRLRHVATVDTAALTGEAASKVKLRLVKPDEDEVIAVAASGSLRIVEFEVDKEAFEDPQFGAPGNDDRLLYDPHTNRWSVQPTVLDDGRVFGHIAPWGICVRGRPDRCITPPNADLEGFMRGRAPLAGGARTGTIVVAGSHCAVGIGAAEATQHYDKTGRAVADVRVGVDAYGIWFAGRLRPGASEEDIYAFKSSDVSGHWEVGKNGEMTLCGLPAVNVGGFPKGYLTAEEVALAASAALADEDCGCDDPAEEPESEQEPTEPEPGSLAARVLGFNEERMLALESALKRIETAVAPMYAAHLAAMIPDDEE